MRGRDAPPEPPERGEGPERGSERGPGSGGSARRIFRLSRRAGRAYQGALEAVLTIPIGLGLGYAADALLETEPAGVLVGLGLGFGAFVLRVIRLRSLLDAEVAREEETLRGEGRGGRGPGGDGAREGSEGKPWERR